MSLVRPRSILLSAVVLMAASGCTQRDEQLFDQVGVTRLFLIDPALAAQSVEDPDRAQVAEWQAVTAALEYGGQAVDLTLGEPCDYVDTTLLSPFPDGACSGGIVVPGSSEAIQIRLTIELSSMRVRRAQVPDLGSGDFDGDGVPDDADRSGSAFDAPCGRSGSSFPCDDNCPLVANPDQTDTNADGIGNACSAFDFFSGLVLRDSDGDAIVDSADNCVAVPNPGQEDSVSGLSADGFPDGIGDACAEQVAVVTVDGNPTFTLQLGPAPLTQPLSAVTLVTVDFSSDDALDCDWDLGRCSLDPSAVRLCGLSSSFLALAGCLASGS